jgi:glycosyltransferase involved in cell wall biosynthesis
MLQSDPRPSNSPATSARPVGRPRLTIGSGGGAPSRHPKLSVLIPTYNYARYLPEAIESVLLQDFQDYEVVIADDCSQDESEAIMRRYAAMDSRVQIQINRSNLGMVANWNYCLSLAQGEYIQFLFGDDKLADPRTLAKMVRLLDENPSAVLGVAARNIIDEHSNVVEVHGQLGNGGLLQGLDVIRRCFVMNQNLIGEPSVVMFRRRNAARGFDAHYRQLPDLEMWFHLLERGPLIYTPEPLYCFRRHCRQQTAVNRSGRIGEREALFLLAEYNTRPWFRSQARRKMFFTQIYTLRKTGGFGEASREMEERLRRSLGQGWYAWFWLLRKLGRPPANLKRFYRKHILHRGIM